MLQLQGARLAIPYCLVLEIVNKTTNQFKGQHIEVAISVHVPQKPEYQ